MTAAFALGLSRSALAKRGTPEELLETALVVSLAEERARTAASILFFAELHAHLSAGSVLMARRVQR